MARSKFIFFKKNLRILIMPNVDYMLLDNGSLNPVAIRQLRFIAQSVSQISGISLAPVSLLHSDRVPARLIDGERAEIFEARVIRKIREGYRRFVIIPLFLGPSRALHDYIPRRIEAIQKDHGLIELIQAPCLVDLKDQSERSGAHPISTIIWQQILQVMVEKRITVPKVILVDHGSPLKTVTEVRNFIAHELRGLAGEQIHSLIAASMERRSESEYDFNEPLLESVFDNQNFGSGEVIVAHLFLLPGWHAGEGGDIDAICRSAMEKYPDLSLYRTSLLGEHPGLVEYLIEVLKLVVSRTLIND